MAKQQRPEIIEVIDSVTPARGFDGAPTARQAGAADAGAPRRVWIAPAAVAAIVVLVVGAALTTGSNDGRSTQRVTSSTSAPSTTVRHTDSLHLVADTPDGYLVDSVSEHTPVDAPEAGAIRELWATHADSAERSSWFQITAGVRTGDAAGAVGERRVAVPAGIAVLGHDADGTITIAGPIGGGGEASVTASGLNPLVLTGVFATLRRSNGRLVHDDPMFGGTFQLVGADAAAAGQPETVTSVTYRAPGLVGGQDLRVSVTVGKPGSAFERSAREFFLTHRATVAVVDGTKAVIGYDTRTTGQQSIVVDRFGQEITVAGNAPRDVLVAAATSLHIAGTAEWQRIEDDAFTTATQPSSPTVSGTRVEVSSGVLDDGSSWILSVNVTPPARVTTSTGVPGTGTLPSAPAAPRLGSVDSVNLESRDGITTAFVGARTSALSSFAVARFSAVVALVPRDRPGATLQITIADHTETVPAVDVGADALVAAYGFDGLTPYTARLVAADGSLISSVTG